MAFSISSGLTPQAGIYCAIVTGFIVSACGGSRTQIAGPTGAFVVVVAGIVAQHGVDGMLMCTMMAGGLLVAMGAMGLGSSVRFIPRPVVVGFTNGIAVLIASTQIRDFFGLRVDQVPGEFAARLSTLAAHAGSWSPQATALGVAVVCTIVAINYFSAVPGAIVALVASTAIAAAFKLNVETVGTRFGGIPTGLPHIV